MLLDRITLMNRLCCSGKAYFLFLRFLNYIEIFLLKKLRNRTIRI